MMDDAPKTSIAEDLLNREEIVIHLAQHILRVRKPEECKRGEVIGLLGSWGSGKTTVMHFVKEAIQTGRLGCSSIALALFGGAKQIWVNLWESEVTDNLLSTVINELGKQVTPGKKSSDFKAAVGTLGRILRTTGGVASCFNPLVGAAMKGVGTLAELEKAEKERQEGLASVSDQYTRLEELALEGTEGRLVIYLDDLDRCSPQHMIEVVEGVRNLLVGTRTTFVLGIDPDVFARALQWKYGSTFPHDEGMLYLEKVLVPCFHLPTVSPRGLLQQHFAVRGMPDCKELADMCARNAELCGITSPRVLKLSVYKLNSFWMTNEAAIERVAKRLGRPQMKDREFSASATALCAATFNLILLRQRYPGVFQRLQHASVRRHEYLQAAWEYWFARRARDDNSIAKSHQRFVHTWGEEPGPLYHSGALHVLNTIHQRLCETREGLATPEASEPKVATGGGQAPPVPEPDDGRFKSDAGILAAASALLDLRIP